MAIQTPANKLFDLLVSKNFEPETLDSSGKPNPDPSSAEIFSFDFTTISGNNYGSVVIMLSDEGDLEVFSGDNVGRTMEGQDKEEWFEFLEQLKNFSTRHDFMNFNTQNINRLKYSMQGQAALKEGLFESWMGNKHTSWNDKPEHVRLMVKHSKAIGEGDARYRYVESLFVETSDGERFKLPFTKLAGGRAMCEHVRNGGKPYDAFGQHIAGIVEELNVLSRFRRANHGKIFEGDTAELINETNSYYENLHKVLKGLSTHRGYKNYFESWNPAEITEQDIVIESIKNMFVRQSIDERIEQALPILARIQQQGKAMKEINIFEGWVNRLMEGTWTVPETPEQKQQLVKLLSQELPVGADATNATEQLYDVFGDDMLFDQLEDLADQDANADARQVILNRLQEMSDNPDIAEVVAQLNIDVDTPVEPADDLNTDVQADEVGAEQNVEECELEPWKYTMKEEDPLNRIKQLAEVGDETLDEAVGSFFVVYDDGRKPFGPMPEDQAKATVAKYKDGQVIPATQLVHWQQANRAAGMTGPVDFVDEEEVRSGALSPFSEGEGCTCAEDAGSCPVHEWATGAAVGGALGAAAAGPVGAGIGSAIGSDIQNKLTKELDETDDIPTYGSGPYGSQGPAVGGHWAMPDAPGVKGTAKDPAPGTSKPNWPGAEAGNPPPLPKDMGKAQVVPPSKIGGSGPTGAGGADDLFKGTSKGNPFKESDEGLARLRTLSGIIVK